MAPPPQDDRDQIINIIRGTLHKVHQAHKGLEGASVVLQKMDYDEKDPIETAAAIVEMVEQVVLDVVRDLQAVCRTRMFDSVQGLCVVGSTLLSSVSTAVSSVSTGVCSVSTGVCSVSTVHGAKFHKWFSFIYLIGQFELMKVIHASPAPNRCVI